MTTGSLKYNSKLRDCASIALPYLRSRLLRGVRVMSRDELSKWLGLKDYEVQKLVHDGHLPKSELRLNGKKAFDLYTSVKLLDSWVMPAQQYEMEI